jgi:hypothetical protein
MALLTYATHVFDDDPGADEHPLEQRHGDFQHHSV